MTLVLAASALTGTTAHAQTVAPTVSAVSATAFDLLHLTSSPATSSIFGQAVTFSVTVTGTTGTPTGAVWFTDSSSLIGIAQLNASGVASFPISTLTPSIHSITASYKGDTVYSAANSSALTFTVNPRPVTTGVSAPTSVVLGAGAVITGYVFDAATVGPGGTNGGPTGKSFPNATGPIFNLPAPRLGHAAVMLSDGSVLISGGTVAGSAVNTLVNYIPGTIIVPDERFVAVTGNMLHARSGHTATLLSDGLTVLITGGDTGGDAELYTCNLATLTGSSVATGSLQSKRSEHTATPLPNGQVLIVGGTVGSSAVSSLEVYNSGGLASSAVTGHRKCITQADWRPLL